MDVVEFDAASLDALSNGSIIELARRVGVLLLEEEAFPDLVRVRLKRNSTE
jgi:hypothetical protein